MTLKEDNLVFLNDGCETEKLGWRSLKSRAKVIQEQICYVDVSSQRLLSPSERHRGHVQVDPVSYWSLAVRAVLNWRSRPLAKSNKFFRGYDKRHRIQLRSAQKMLLSLAESFSIRCEVFAD